MKSAQKKTDWVVYGSYGVSFSIILMFMGYLIGFVVQYRSMKRLILILIENRCALWVIYVLSLILMVVYFCSLAQALVYFWGIIALP